MAACFEAARSPYPISACLEAARSPYYVDMCIFGLVEERLLLLRSVVGAEWRVFLLGQSIKTARFQAVFPLRYYQNVCLAS